MSEVAAMVRAADDGVGLAPVPRRRRRRRRWGAALAVVVAAGVASAVLLAALPGVGGTQALVAARLRTHGATYDVRVVPSRLADAAVAVEDRRFYRHHGVDVRGVARGAWGAVAGGRDRGGSTITQQLAKLIYTPGERGVAAKFEQVGLAVKLERRFSKTKILELYLNSGYYGHGFWGAAAAANGYFGVAPAQLDWGQAALLAGLLQSPSDYDPYRYPARARARQRHVLDRLVATGRLSAGAAKAAGRAPLLLGQKARVTTGKGGDGLAAWAQWHRDPTHRSEHIAGAESVGG